MLYTHNRYSYLALTGELWGVIPGLFWEKLLSVQSVIHVPSLGPLMCMQYCALHTRYCMHNNGHKDGTQITIPSNKIIARPYTPHGLPNVDTWK